MSLHKVVLGNSKGCARTDHHPDHCGLAITNSRCEAERAALRDDSRIRNTAMNPDETARWEDYRTTRVIRKMFPMFHLSVDGLTDAVQALVGARS